ncbi:response regulator [bacterium]|nr:response regulator [bacterium]
MNKLKKILYVEDDQDIAQITSIVLDEMGQYEVLHVSNGQEAIDQVPVFKPQLILMDVMMPGMDGQEAFIKLKEKGYLNNVPVVFMTAKAQVHEQKKYMELGALGVIVKPFDLEILCATIEDYWKGQ